MAVVAVELVIAADVMSADAVERVVAADAVAVDVKAADVVELVVAVDVMAVGVVGLVVAVDVVTAVSSSVCGCVVGFFCLLVEPNTLFVTSRCTSGGRF